MNYIKLNGISFDADVAISKYNRNFNVLDGENAGRVMTGRMVRDIIGTYLGHKLTVFRRGDNYKGLDDFGTTCTNTAWMTPLCWKRQTVRLQSLMKRIIPARRRTWRRAMGA